MCMVFVLTDLFDLTYASCKLSCNKCKLMGVKIIYVWISLMC
jgi:hypothetical protein